MPARAASECDFAVVHASSIMNALTKTFQLVCCQKLKPENRICKVEAKKQIYCHKLNKILFVLQLPR